MKNALKYLKKNALIIVIIIVICTVIIFYLNNRSNKKMEHSEHSGHSEQNVSASGSNPCTDTLTDLEYLEHMIPHHQVAIDMSKLLEKRSQSPQMLHICRDITRKQSYEIWEMEIMKEGLSDTLFNGEKGSVDKVYTVLDKFNPIMSKSKDGSCNPLFFKPNDHSKMMKHMEINDTSYLEHMIPHHQVAIDMSKRLLLHTNNSYLVFFCRKLIVDQQSEIYFMNNLLNNTYEYKSKLL